MALRQWFLFCWTNLAVLLSFSLSMAGEPPLATGADQDLPTPPQQSAPWTPANTKLPKNFVTAAKHLFQIGLTDPRGCEYREIVWVRLDRERAAEIGRNAEVRIVSRGWVLPANGSSVRFAIGWNGVVYPLASVGKAVNLQEDIFRAIKEHAANRIAALKKSNNAASHEGSPALQVTLEFDPPISPLSAAMLLRLGRADLAEAVWNEGKLPLPDRRTAAKDDPYLDMAGYWTSALEVEAWDAHASGDDCRALGNARLLVSASDAIEAEARRRNLWPARGKDKSTRYLAESDVARLLLADQERRARNRQRSPLPRLSVKSCGSMLKFWDAMENELKKSPDGATRTAKLIEHLDESSGNNLGDVQRNPIIQLLINEGDSAVEPLIHCTETDTRLTRISYIPDGSGMGQTTHVMASELAYDAVEHILEDEFFPFVSRLGGHGWIDSDESLQETYNRWRPYRNLPKYEMWYRVLADDNRPDLWLQAAELIVGEEGSIRSEPWMLLEAPSRPAYEPHKKTELPGEPLRDKRLPSVTELMTKRAKEISRRQKEISEAEQKRLSDELTRLEESDKPLDAKSRDRLVKLTDELQPQLQIDESPLQGCKLALCLGHWDRKAAAPLLKEMSLQCRGEITHGSENAQGAYSQIRSELYSMVAQLTMARVECGDSQALDEYAEWVRGVVPSDASDDEAILAPLRLYGDNEVIAIAADRLFTNDNSAWNPARRLSHGDFGYLRGTALINSSFRNEVSKLLSDKRTSGVATVSSTSAVELRNSSDSLGTVTPAFGDPLLPPKGSTIEFRLCDLGAYALSRLEGAPQCELYWPQERRDRAVQATQEYLARRGHRFQVPGEPIEAGNSEPIILGKAFRPRWLDERGARLTSSVNNGQPADFESLFNPVPGIVRSCKLPSYLPLPAVWTKLEERAVFAVDDYSQGTVRKIVDYDQQGVVWQAEEIKINGAWKRYYGFVGPHCIANVPAEEIAFPSDDDCFLPDFTKHAGPAIDAVVVPMIESKGGLVPATQWPIVLRRGKPMIVKLRARNHTGVDQVLPPLVEDRPGVAIPPGGYSCHIEIDFTPYNCTEKRIGGMPAAMGMCVDWDEMPWQSAPRRAGTSFQFHRPAAPLKPAEEFDVLEFDLAGLFDIKRSGSCEVWLTFTPYGASPKRAEKKRWFISFLIADPPQGKAMKQ